MSNFKSEVLRKNRITGYRRKQNLCLLCGKEKDHTDECIVDYIQVDNRIIKEPEISTTIQLKNDKNIFLQRPFIIINNIKSSYGNIIEFSSIQYISKKYNNFIICIFNDLEKNLPVHDVFKIKKLLNINILNFLTLQDKINYIHSCKYFFSYDCDLLNYCKLNSIMYYEFNSNKNVTNFLKNVPQII